MSTFPQAIPEEVGIPSRSIYNFIDKLSQHKLPMHSVLIMRHGQLITDAYYFPYTSTTLHRMFSVTKSFTSIGIGQLIGEGKLSLEDKIITYFPDKLPKAVHPFIAQMTIKDMLTMQTCHSQTTYKADPTSDWVESFFKTIPTHQPGTSFNYDTSASHTLCALVERLSQKPLLDYLRDMFLDQTPFSDDAYILKDPFGVSMGGSGLMATPMDILIFASIIMNKGYFLDQKLITKDYLVDATAYHSHTLINGPTLEERQGYGYQFWRIQNGGFACYGMGGQLAICLPEYDLILVTTADTQGIQGGNQLIYNALYDEILPHLSPTPLAANPADSLLLENQIKELAIQPLEGHTTSTWMSKINQKSYHLEANAAGFDAISLAFCADEKEGVLNFTLHNKDYMLPFGFGKMVLSSFPIYQQRCVSSGVWLSSDTLCIKSHLIDECIGSVHFHLTFKERTVSIYMKKIEETYFNEFTGYLQGTLG